MRFLQALTITTLLCAAGSAMAQLPFQVEPICAIATGGVTSGNEPCTKEYCACAIDEGDAKQAAMDMAENDGCYNCKIEYASECPQASNNLRGPGFCDWKVKVTLCMRCGEPITARGKGASYCEAVNDAIKVACRVARSRNQRACSYRIHSAQRASVTSTCCPSQEPMIYIKP